MSAVFGAASPQEEEPEVRAGSVSADEHRRLMSCFPTGVAVVSVLDEFGVPQGMTCTSLTSVSLCPPTLLVCLRRGSRTLAALRARRTFGVNLLHAHAQKVAELFSSPTPDRYHQVAWQPFGPARVPLLTDAAFAIAECRFAGSTIRGDHEIILGVTTRIMHQTGTPLLYGMKSFSAWSVDRAIALSLPASTVQGDERGRC